MKTTPRLIACVIALICMPYLFSQEWYDLKVIVLSYIEALGSSTETLDEFILPDGTTNHRAFLSAEVTTAQQFLVALYSYIIYGHNFVFTPSDIYRNIDEVWEMTPIAEILPNDSRLIELDRNITQNYLQLVYRYNLDGVQVRWLKDWEESDVLVSAAKGIVRADGVSAYEGKMAAIQDGIKLAVERVFKETIPSKPLQVTGTVKLAEQPYVIKNGSYYTANVKIQVRIASIKEQQAF